ncbi:AlbA family DNA-binding domain-containing protein [Massilia endophytica]|uniref:AlbA family DNA-binding domain-containing protein n=1 Tax=Massilia endophytica TaxID=2899220 RepID=UPI001E53E46D|nr:ATP-binding protein [Massilia endophytica]UGQ45115.1 ATP-binding protein [Massilia endophytica]
MIPKQLESITQDDVQQLLENAVVESRTIEYKKVPPANSDGDKVKFLRTVSGMANTDGGDLIYGIEANEGVPVAATGIPLLEIDSLKLRLESMLQNCVEPRIPGVAMHIVPMQDEVCVLIVRIRRSWLLPHRIAVGSHVQFYARGSASTFPMDVSQLREAFLYADQQAAKVQSFVVDRLLRIEQRRTPVSLTDGVKVVLHVLPLSSLARNNNQQLVVPKSERSDFPLYEDSTKLQRPNADGFILTDQRGSDSEMYTQVFRSGAVEATMVIDTNRTDKGIPSFFVEVPTLRTLEKIVEQLSQRGILAPYVVSFSFIGVEGHFLMIGSRPPYRATRYSEPVLILPDALIEDIQSFRSWELMRPIFDIFWNAFGYEGSPNYDADGNYKS